MDFVNAIIKQLPTYFLKLEIYYDMDVGLE